MARVLRTNHITCQSKPKQTQIDIDSQMKTVLLQLKIATKLIQSTTKVLSPKKVTSQMERTHKIDKTEVANNLLYHKGA